MKTTKIETVASADFTEVSGVRVTEEAKSRIHHVGPDSRLRDVADEEMNKHDIIGTLLKGSDWRYRVLVTYNRITNTYFMNYNSTVIPEEDVAFGMWANLTDLGAVKISNLRKWYAEKMPHRLQELKERLWEQPTPSENRLREGGFEPLPVAHHHRGRAPLDENEMLEYDLDNVHLSSAGPAFKRSTKADIDYSTNDPFVDSHSFLEAQLGNVGFVFDPVSKADGRYVYRVTHQGVSLTDLDVNDGRAINEVTTALRLVIDGLGWFINEVTFPLRTDSSLCWIASDDTIMLKVNTEDSTIEFLRVN